MLQLLVLSINDGDLLFESFYLGFVEVNLRLEPRNLTALSSTLVTEDSGTKELGLEFGVLEFQTRMEVSEGSDL